MVSTIAMAQDDPVTEQDSTKTGYSLGKIDIPNPPSISSKYTYDPITDRYIYTETVGEFNINYPVILTPEEFEALVAQESLKAYYKEKIDAYDGIKEGAEEEQKNLLPAFYVNSSFFETIFGGDTVEVIPQGSVEMDLGVLFSKQDNPAFSPRNRSNFTFDFDQRISLSLLGKVGTRLQVNANYDTQSTFDFQNVVKLEYTPTEDDIIQKIEVGNVSMPLTNSLITGAQSLFGVKTQLQFGRTTVTAVFSEQKSDTRTVVAQGGGTLEEFEFFARDYDENRHFFLSQYFRDNYDKSLSKYPYIANNIQITRIEVWVTNRNNSTDNVRNVVAFQDIGETDKIFNDQLNIFNPGGSYPDNGNNGFDPTNVGGAGSQLNDAVRDIATVQSGILIPGTNEGSDYGKLENARKLTQGSEYTLHPQLGYISLNQRLNNDETLAVAYQFTVGGQVYQVGEFANDGVPNTDDDGDGIPNIADVDINGDGTPDNGTDSDGDGINDNSDVDQTGGNDNDGNGIDDAVVVAQNGTQTLLLKMLKSSITNVQQPIWDLMMKNIYDTGAYQLEQEEFRLNIFYNEASALNYIKPVEGTVFPPFDPDNTPDPDDGYLITETPLIRLFNLDRLNYNNDPQAGGDGFFDYVPGITVIPQNGKIVFTKVEPFGRYLFDILDDDGTGNNNQDYEDGVFNPNQNKYVYDVLYKSTKTAALEAVEKNKFQLKGRYKSAGGEGIPIGAFNVPRGSVRVTAGGRVLVEGIDYTVNYQLGRVQILDEALKASNTPIEVSTENNAVFGQQTKRYMGLNVEHRFNENFVLNGTVINLRERPITQKANYSTEPINNTMLGFNGNYSTEVPFLTRMVNKLPNIDTDVPSNLSVRGDFAYLKAGAPKGTDFNGEATAYIDDFEGSQNSIDLRSPQSWFHSSRPLNLNGTDVFDANGIENGFGRARLNWYMIDPVFYSSQRPGGITDDDLSSLFTSRVFIQELFPDQDLVQGQTTVLNTLDLAYYPDERGIYNFDPNAQDGQLDNPTDSWAGITRQLTSTDFEQANVEYIEFWLQDPFQENSNNPGGKLVFNLGNVSEDVIKDGRKQYENGLPSDGNVSMLPQTVWGTVVPQNQSLVYTFDTTGQERTNQDVGYDGYDDQEEAAQFGAAFGEDPALDNYTYFLNTDGDLFERYRKYNGVQGNSPETFTDTNRGSTTQPDVEDINRDNTMNTIDSYFEYILDIKPEYLPEFADEIDDLPDTNPLREFIVDVKNKTRDMPNGDTDVPVRWYQFRVPVNQPIEVFDDNVQYPQFKRYNGISDFRSVRFARIYLNEFTQPTVMRFGALDLVRSDWRRYTQILNNDNQEYEDTDFTIGVISTQENEGNYVSPPGVYEEQLFNNNTVVDQNEQSMVLNVCDLHGEDSRAVYKNINLDMRQYKKIRMFMHAEGQVVDGLESNEMVGFIRMGNDLNENYYQVEIPLQVSIPNSTDPNEVWPADNEIDLPLKLLQEIKAKSISADGITSGEAIFYDVVDGGLTENSVPEFSEHTPGQQRVAIKGNPNFGSIRTLMIGIKNPADPGLNDDACGTFWFNELRLSDMDNEGGWAAVLSMDSNIADFANISATGRTSTSGFGSIEQTPNERSREDVKQYDVVTNVNIGQLLPKDWGIQIPFNYGVGEEIITPKYDQFYGDIELDTRLDNAESDEEREEILNANENYTKRKSINFIGVRKNRTTEKRPHFYDVENLTLNYSYNKVEHRDFEIENSVDKTVRAGVNYSYNFNPVVVEPFKKNDSLFTGKNWKLLKDFNLSLLPATFSVNTDINRRFNQQKFREVDLTGDNLQLETLYKRNYTFDFQYTINYNLTQSLQLNFTASNNNIVRNYFVDNDIRRGEQDPTLGVWDGFFDFGDPNRQYQQLGINYDIPLYKIPALSFLRATYSYTGDFQWQKGSDEINPWTPPVDPGETTQSYNLGHSIQNANTHNINSTLDMNKLYRYIGLVKKPVRGSRDARSRDRANAPDDAKDDQQAKKKSNGGTKLLNAGIDLLTSVKRIQVNYSENNGNFLPGYLQTPGFIGTFKPTFGYTFGSQSDVRSLAARNGWLTTYPEFNQQYTEVHNRQLDIAANIEPVRDLKIDLVMNRLYSDNYTENYRVEDYTGPDGVPDGIPDYNSLTPNEYGNFNISTIMLGTAFGKSDEFGSDAFDDLRNNRLEIARRVAASKGVDMSNPDNFENGDVNGFPLGYGKTSQQVLLPSFLAAYTGKSASSISLSSFRDTPLPNWDVKYTGLMKFKWFKEKFKRFSLTHGYRSTYTINQFRSNLDYQDIDYGISYNNQPDDVLNQSGDYKSKQIYSNVNLSEMFTPLIRVDFEMKNSIKILTEIRRDRSLSLSFDNNLLTEIQGNEYRVGLGYRFKDVRLKSKLAGPRQTIMSDLIMQADIAIRDNKTIIRYLDVENNQITSGQTIWGAKYTAEYAFSKYLTGIFYFDYSFSEYAISTAFPQTTIRSGFTLRYNFGN